jgi:hypothetical protein
MPTGSTARQAEGRIDDGLVGAFRRFGEHGIAYEVIGLDGQEHVRIRVVETGETLSYPAASVRADPEA